MVKPKIKRCNIFIIIATVVDESFFASKDSGKSIPGGTFLDIKLPKMLSNDALATAEAIANASKAIVVTELAIVMIMAVSLK